MTPKKPLPPPKKSKLTSLKIFLFFSFPFVLYFSYHPVIPLFSSASTNYELSLPLLWLAVFSLLSLPAFLRAIYNIYKSRPYLLLALLFPLYLSLSALWSPNPLRAVLTSGIFWCLIISAAELYRFGSALLPLSFPCPLKHLPLLSSLKTLLPRVPTPTLLRRIFLGSALVISLFCWFQSFLDVLLPPLLSLPDTPRVLTLLCPGCTSRIFGFPHPSGFAIEPQFMGNLLLAPALYSVYEYSHRRLRLPLPLFLVSTLFVIFSRGAIYSFLAALCLFLVLELAKNKNRRALLAVPLVLASLIVCFASQAVFSAIVKKTSPACAVSASVSQLSLGLLSPSCSTPQLQPPALPASDAPSKTPLTPSSTPPVFTGYVKESTNIRLSLSRLALASVAKSPLRLLFGTGLGSAGKVLFEDGLIASEKGIVQNQYISLLLETGIVGLSLLALSLALLLRSLSKIPASSTQKSPSPALSSPLLPSVLLACALSLLFFSGLPNALHIYLLPSYLLLLTSPKNSQKSKNPSHP